MQIELSDQAKKQLKKLPPPLKRKAQKAFGLLTENYRHPSLRTRKMSGHPYFEARIDYHYRFIFSYTDNVIEIITLGPHDTGLGKK